MSFTIHFDGGESTHKTALEACDDIVGCIADDYANGRWGRIIDADGNEIAVDITVRPASSRPPDRCDCGERLACPSCDFGGGTYPGD